MSNRRFCNGGHNGCENRLHNLSETAEKKTEQQVIGLVAENVDLDRQI